MERKFLVIPAVDLKEGRCVRLRQGVATAETVYGSDPLAMARTWQREGAEYLHLVDLDGAFAGKVMQSVLVGAIAQAVTIPVEVGGGVRTRAEIRRYLDLGVKRVVIGTWVCGATDEDLAALFAEFGPALAVGIDARGGAVQVKGWTETTALAATDLAKRLARLGAQTIIYTDTARDGMLLGANMDAVFEMCDSVSCNVIASGGVSSAEDVLLLREGGRDNLLGVIVGKALYEGRVSLAELLGAGE